MTEKRPQMKTVGLFPTPVSVFSEVITPEEIEPLATFTRRTCTSSNARCAELLHTPVYREHLPSPLVALVERIAPCITAYGEVMFGEALTWKITGIWCNLARDGAFQVKHNHANSLISGTVYLTSVMFGSCTTFHKSEGGTDFTFDHRTDKSRLNEFNAPSWSPKAVAAGDVILFPSYLMHEVPRVRGDDRMTVAFNAVPTRLDYGGYSLHLS